MFHGAFSLLERSLRIDARGWTTHLARFGLMLAIYIALCLALFGQSWFGAPGMRFFQSIAYLDATFMTLLGIGFFSTAISEEKEEDTLGLMLMAGISPLGLLLGKSTGRLWQALLLVAVQYPFMLLAVTMGGVTADQVWAVTVALLAYLIFLAGLGLLCSTLAPRSRTAAGMMILALCLYLLVPMFAQWLIWFYGPPIPEGQALFGLSRYWWMFVEGTSQFCVPLQLSTILTTTFDDSELSMHVVSNVIAGLICAGLSWLMFGFATRNPSTESTSRGLISQRRAFLRFDAGRPWGNPFLWKDFHFVAGGFGMICTRIAFYCLLPIVVYVNEYVTETPTAGNDMSTWLVAMSFLVATDAGIVLSRSIHDEIRSQTLSSLMMLPHSSIAITYAKFAGALLGWLPGPLIEVAFALSSYDGQRDFYSLAMNEHSGWGFVLLFVMIPHFAALFALYMRWGAVPLAICVAVGVLFFVRGVVASLNLNGNSPFFTWLTIVMAFACVGCQIGVLLRVQALSAR